jgi:CheY-like chemotaxis protein
MKAPVQRVAGLFAVFFGIFCLVVVGFWLFGEHVFSFLLARSRAYTPPQFLTWLSLASGVTTAVVFCVLPFSLFRVVRRRSDVPFGWVVLCIAAFLFLTGATGLAGLITLWSQGAVVMWSLVLARVVIALLAVATLLSLRALVPRILEIPTREQWLALNNDLLRAEAEVEAKNKLLAIVSHELRTPLAPLLATLTELEGQIPSHGNAAMRQSLEVLRKNIRREAHLINDLIDRLELPAPEEPPAPLAEKYATPKRLLLVEDHVDTLRTFARLLRRKGFEVKEACTFSEAIASARLGDLLLSDIGLPDGDGRDLMRNLRAMGIPGIAISGFGTAKDRQEYREAGFAESFVKPVDLQELLSAIGRVTGAGDGAGAQ